jgi:hypothetical protein
MLFSRRRLAPAFFFCGIFFLTLTLASQALAGIGFQPVNPDELKMTTEPKAPGAAAIILFRQVERDDTGNNPHEDSYFRIKILKEEGRKYADVEIRFSKADGQSVYNVKARTIRPDGTVANFEGKPFETTIVKAKGLKYLAKTLTLPDVQVGSIIEYQYSISFQENYVFDSHWIISSDLYTKHAHFKLRPYTSQWSSLGLRWTWQGINTAPKDEHDRGITLDVSDIPAFEAEDYMPPENEYKARVDFIYTEDTEREPAKFWKSTNKRINGRLDDFIDRKKAMEQAVSGMVSASDTPEVKAQKIYAAVQKLRNTSYEKERTEAEIKRDKEKPINNVEDLWKAGRGNGFQITWLYLALVRAAGIDASPLLMSDRKNYFMNPASMNSKQLNENAVLLRFGDKKVFCDPGTAYLPYGELPWPETAVKALVVDKNNVEWVDTPLPASDVNGVQRTAKLKLNEETGGLEGTLKVRYMGVLASYMRRVENLEDDAARKKYMEDGIKQMVSLVSDVELKSKVDWTSSTTVLEAEFEIKIPGWAQQAGRRVLLPQGIFGNEQKHVFEHANRVYPIYYEYSEAQVDDISIQLPEGWTVGSVPKPEAVEQKVITYLSKCEGKGNTLHISRKFATDIQMVAAKSYPQLQNFYRFVRTTDEEQIVVQPGAGH